MMATRISQVFKNKTPNSSAEYKIMSKKSDGNLPDKKVKPATPTDKKIHIGHIVDSGQYNLRHTFDHSDELAFDYQRLSKELPTEAKILQKSILSILNPVYKKAGIKLEKING